MASAQIEGEGASSSSSSVVEDDDEDEFVTTRIRFAAPGNRRRRQSRARARVGEARVAALGARGDDSKGFGVLGEQGVAFAAAGPAGRRRRDVARSRSPLLERCLDATPPSPKEGVARAPRGAASAYSQPRERNSSAMPRARLGGGAPGAVGR